MPLVPPGTRGPSCFVTPCAVPEATDQTLCVKGLPQPGKGL